MKNLYTSRFWSQSPASRTCPIPAASLWKAAPKAPPTSSRAPTKGILVTRLWYIRPVDPQTLLYTGLTRDGTFYIENGAIKFPVKNFRFNESPIIMLNNLEAIGRPVRASRQPGAALENPGLYVHESVGRGVDELTSVIASAARQSPPERNPRRSFVYRSGAIAALRSAMTDDLKRIETLKKAAGQLGRFFIIWAA
ncbi:MAG: metallopeptidase TldD-related protein [Hymenobacter sp.]